MGTDRTNWAIENVVHIVVASVLDNVLFIYSIDIEYHDCYSEHGLFNTHIVDVYKCHWNNGCACECDRGTLFFPLNHTFYASLTERRETKKLFCSMELLTKKIALIHKWNRCHARHCSCMMYLREIDDIGFILIHLFSHSFDLAPCICICACIKIFASFF